MIPADQADAFGSYDPKERPVRSHAGLDHAFDYMNGALFDGALPPCLITLQRSRGAYGYFSGDRFVNIDSPSEIVDEIALNPRHFATQSTREVLGTLAHEMAHLWQHHFGKPGRGRYHNLEWARKMEANRPGAGLNRQSGQTDRR